MADFDPEWLIYRPGTKHQETFLSLWGGIRLSTSELIVPDDCAGRFKDYTYTLEFSRYVLWYQNPRFIYPTIIDSDYPFTIQRHAAPGSIVIYFISNGRSRLQGRSTAQWRMYKDVWVGRLTHKISGQLIFAFFNGYPPELSGYSRNVFLDSGGIIWEFPNQFLTLTKVTPEEYCDSTEKEYRRPWGCGYVKEYNYIIYKGAIRCPDCTCLELDCGDKICCYGDNGKPLIYYDKPKLI